MRLGKYLAHAGVASRRAAEQLVFDGRVAVRGQTVTDPARDVSDEDAVAVDGRPVSAGGHPRLVYLLHKPLGVVGLHRRGSPEGVQARHGAGSYFRRRSTSAGVRRFASSPSFVSRIRPVVSASRRPTG